MQPSGGDQPELDGDIVFEQVSFGYPKAKEANPD